MECSGALRNGYFPSNWRQCKSHWIHTTCTILILGESLFAIKLYLIMIILDHAHILKGKNAVGKIAKPGAVPASAGASTLLQPRVVTRSHWGS